MIVVCTCGQKCRVKLHVADKIRCPRCKTNLGAETERQAARNADAMLAIAGLLYAIPITQWTREQEEVAKILAAYERGYKQP